MMDWWNSLSIASQVFYCVAIPATLLLVIQTVLLFLGIGDDSDGDVSSDAPDTPDTVSDAPDADAAETDVAGWDSLKLFTLRGIVAFFVTFGWVGVVMDDVGASLFATIPVAFVSGAVVMILLALLFKWLMKLRADGTLDNRNAIGMSCKVYLTIPPARSGEGKVQIMIQGVYSERSAVTDDDAPIPTGSEAVVVGVSGQTDLVVRKK